MKPTNSIRTKASVKAREKIQLGGFVKHVHNKTAIEKALPISIFIYLLLKWISKFSWRVYVIENNCTNAVSGLKGLPKFLEEI